VFRHHPHYHDPKMTTWEGKLPDSVEVIVATIEDNNDKDDTGTVDHGNDDSEHRSALMPVLIEMLIMMSYHHHHCTLLLFLSK